MFALIKIKTNKTALTKHIDNTEDLAIVRRVLDEIEKEIKEKESAK